MRIVGRYSFNGGREALEKEHPELLKEVEEAIESVPAHLYKTKQSEEKTMKGKLLYSPPDLNNAIKNELIPLCWKKHRIDCEYSTEYYEDDFKPTPFNKGAFREMDFVKNRVGVEVQFGKYAFMVYNVCAKMTIFNKLGIIDKGIEVVPVKKFVDEFSSGVSYYEQFVWDLDHRGISDIDIPVLILGIADIENPPEYENIEPLPIGQKTKPGPKT